MLSPVTSPFLQKASQTGGGPDPHRPLLVSALLI